MKIKIDILKFFLISILCISNLFSSENSLKIGLLYEKIFATKKEASIGSKIWLKQMKEKDYGKIEVQFYEKDKNIIDDIEYWKDQLLESTPLWLMFELINRLEEYKNA